MTSAMTPSAGRKPERLLSREYSLCREDVVWLLDFIKKKVAEQDPSLLALTHPRLMRNFQFFSEISMMLIRHRPVWDQEDDRLKQLIREAAYGLLENDPL